MKNSANSSGLLSGYSLCFLIIHVLMNTLLLIIYLRMNVPSLLLFAQPFTNRCGILCKPLKTGTSNVLLEKLCFTGTNEPSHYLIVGTQGNLKVRFSGSSTAPSLAFRIFQYVVLINPWTIILLNLGFFFFVFDGAAS